MSAAQYGEVPMRHQVHDLDFFDVGRAYHQRFHQRFRLGAARVDVHPHTRFHAGHGLAGGYKFAAVLVDPGH